MSEDSRNFSACFWSLLYDVLQFVLGLFGIAVIIAFILFVILVCTFIYNAEIHTPSLDVRFDSASITSLNDVIGPNLNAKLNITFIVANQNKYNISCANIAVTLFDSTSFDYRGDHHAVLVTARLPPFSQLNQSESKFSVQLNLVDQFVDNNIVVDNAHRSMTFGLELSAEISRRVDNNSFIDKLFARMLGDKAHYNDVQFCCKPLKFVFKPDNATFAYGTCLSLCWDW